MQPYDGTDKGYRWMGRGNGEVRGESLFVFLSCYSKVEENAQNEDQVR